jgi:hypothetical protein
MTYFYKNTNINDILADGSTSIASSEWMHNQLILIPKKTIHPWLLHFYELFLVSWHNFRSSRWTDCKAASLSSGKYSRSELPNHSPWWYPFRSSKKDKCSCTCSWNGLCLRKFIIIEFSRTWWDFWVINILFKWYKYPRYWKRL